ncbi:DUF2934 domain-containing protein [Azospirillum sp. sgz302134]
MQGDREERIRHRAYEIWEREGQPEGRGDAHWAQACAEIDAEDRAASASDSDAGIVKAGIVKKVVRRTRKAAEEALGAGLNAVVDVVEEALAPKKPRARKAKGEAAPADKPSKAAPKGEAAKPAPKPAPKAAAKKSQLPVVDTGSHALAKTDLMDDAEKAVKPARGKARRKAPAGQNTEAAH